MIKYSTGIARQYNKLCPIRIIRVDNRPKYTGAKV